MKQVHVLYRSKQLYNLVKVYCQVNNFALPAEEREVDGKMRIGMDGGDGEGEAEIKQVINGLVTNPTSAARLCSVATAETESCFALFRW